MTMYCSRECQTKDWHKHKAMCKEICHLRSENKKLKDRVWKLEDDRSKPYWELD